MPTRNEPTPGNTIEAASARTVGSDVTKGLPPHSSMARATESMFETP